MRTGTLVTVSTLIVLLAPALGEAQVSADAALESYQLTMPNIRKMADAYERMDAALAANPSLASKLSTDEATSAEDLVARMDAEPVVRQAMAGAGITARDLVLTQFAMFTAGMNDFAVQAGGKEPAAPAAAANLRLYQQNRTEIEAITARLKQLSIWQAPQDDEDSDD